MKNKKKTKKKLFIQIILRDYVNLGILTILEDNVHYQQSCTRLRKAIR